MEAEEGLAPRRKLNVDLAAIIQSAHDVGAALVGIKELALDQPEPGKAAGSEAKRLADAAEKVMEFYPDTQIAPKTMAWINLVFTAAGIYGAKFMLWSAAHPPKPKATVTVMPGGKTPQPGANAPNGHAASMQPPPRPVMDANMNPAPEPAGLDLDI